MAQVAEPENEQSCWLWLSNTDAKGYARLTLRLPSRKNPTAVRVTRLVEGIFRARARDAEDLFDVLDPDEETIQHLCTCTSCVNPDH